MWRRRNNLPLYSSELDPIFAHQTTHSDRKCFIVNDNVLGSIILEYCPALFECCDGKVLISRVQQSLGANTGWEDYLTHRNGGMRVSQGPNRTIPTTCIDSAVTGFKERGRAE